MFMCVCVWCGSSEVKCKFTKSRFTIHAKYTDIIRSSQLAMLEDFRLIEFF